MIFFLNCIKTKVNTREKFLCQQAKNNQYFPGFLFQIQMEITYGLFWFVLFWCFNSILHVIFKQKTLF